MDLDSCINEVVDDVLATVDTDLDLDNDIDELTDNIFLVTAMARMQLYQPKPPSYGRPPEYITIEPWEVPTASDFDSPSEYSSRCLVNLNPLNTVEVHTGMCWWPTSRPKGNTNLRALMQYQRWLIEDEYQREFPNTVALYKKLTARRLLHLMYRCWLEPRQDLLDIAEFEPGTLLNDLLN
jgi:hypothetical protein